MNKAKDAIKGFWTRTRGLVRGKGGEGRGDGGDERRKSPGDGILRRLIPLACALAVSVVVFAILTQCEYGAWAYGFPPLSPLWCGRASQTFGFMSTSGGAGFLVFLAMEVAAMIFAQIWKDRQIDRAARREEAAERRAETAELRAETAVRMMELAEQARREDAERAERREEAAERRAELAEQARREDADRAERRAEAAERMAEAAERRELLLLELIASMKNGGDDANGKVNDSE